ncbi:MAG: hypothetical protein H6862_00385 [Rhodospirillales bacterium]|nr:hypothetical protein [Rhodospirillales bacterium]
MDSPNPTETDISGRRFPALAQQVVESSAKGHVLLGEPHADGMALRSYQFLAGNPQMFQDAAKNGVKHLALEMPQALQGKVDDYVSGKIDRAQLERTLYHEFQTPWAEGSDKKEFGRLVVDTIDNAKSAGMKVHMADVSWSDISLTRGPSGLNPSTVREIESLEKEISKAHAESGSKESLQAFSKTYVDSLSEDRKAQISHLSDSIWAQKEWERMNDEEQYAHLRKEIPANEKMMMVVGVKHISGVSVTLPESDPRSGTDPKGIDRFLKEEEGHTVTTIGLWTSDDQKKSLTASDPENKTGSVTWKGTDYSASFDSGKVSSEDKKPSQTAALPQSSPEPTFGFGG